MPLPYIGPAPAAAADVATKAYADSVAGGGGLPTNADGLLVLSESFQTPTSPTTGVAMFTKLMATRRLPAYEPPTGEDQALQTFLGRSNITSFKPHPGSTTLTGLGVTLSATSTSSVATLITPASTSLTASTLAVEFAQTAAQNNNVAGFRTAAANSGLYMWRGNAAGLGGFMFVCRFRTLRAWPSTQRCFVGLTSSSAAPSDVQPSSLVQTLGVGHDAADTNWQIMWNDATVTAAKTNTGIARPTADNQLLEIIIYCKPFDSTVYFQFSELQSGTTFSTSTTTQIPSTTTFLAPRGYRSVGGTSSLIGLGLVSLYTESNY